MAPDPRTELKYLRERIQNSDDIVEKDREALVAFDDKLTLLKAEYSPFRHLKLLRHVTIIAEQVGSLADSLHEREATEEILRWINRTYDNEETNRDYRVALSVFGRKTTEENGNDPPDSISWIPSGTSKNYDPAPDPADMLHWEEEIIPMIAETRNSRDTAAIALQFDAGLRGFEFKDLTVGSVTEHKNGLQVTANGKQGQRTVTLIPSVPYVNRWLSDHPGQGDVTAPLWSKLSKPEDLSYPMILKMFKEPASRVGVTKPVTLTNFRKSSASYLASRGMNQAHIEDHHGWVRGSKVAARYISVFGDESDRELARIHGLETDEEEPEPIAPTKCPRCGERTPPNRDTCVWCGQALTQQGAITAEKLDDLLFEAMAQASGDDAARLLQFRNDMADNPELRADSVAAIADLLEEH